MILMPKCKQSCQNHVFSLTFHQNFNFSSLEIEFKNFVLGKGCDDVECDDASDCTKGDFCIDGQCVTPQSCENSACATAGQVCDPGTHLCVLGDCTAADLTNCPPHNTCVDFKCVAPECTPETVTTDCPAENQCVDFKCVAPQAGCQKDGDCTDGKFCGCQKDDDCTGGSC